MIVEYHTTDLFDWLKEQTARKVFLVGGSGSSKSWSIAQHLIINKIFREKDKKFLILRKTLPALKITAYDLMRRFLIEYKVDYKENKSDMFIHCHHNIIYFKSLDDREKIKSAEFNYEWLEEATELTLDDFIQLNLRLRHKNDLPNQMFCSFNPIDANHWLKTEIIDKDNEIALNKSNYKDNPFLDDAYRHELERLNEQNPNYYRIYTLGEWGILENIIYTNYDRNNDVPDNPEQIIYGLDFGFENPSVVLKLTIKEKDIWIEELLYQTHLTNSQLIERMKTFDIKRNNIYADNAEPNRIEEIHKAGFCIYPAKKDVIFGIDSVKNFKLHLTDSCVYTLKEIQGYARQVDKNDKVKDEPVKYNDHAMDALRYAIYTAKSHIKLHFAIARTK